MSVVTYGSVELPLTKVNSISQEPVYTEDGQDYQYTRFVLDVSCIFSGSLMDGYDTPTEAMEDLRGMLLTPRLKLRVTIDGQPLVMVGGPDVAGGPFPRNVMIRQIIGKKLFHVNFVIEASQQNCSDPNHEVISNRWRVSHEYDESCFCTRRIDGVAVVNGESGVPPDSAGVRALVMPALPKGWKRTGMSFAPSSNGLRLNYSITDKEQFRVPPTEEDEDGVRTGATSASATYTERSGEYGTNSFADFRITLSGTKTTPFAQLLKMASQIALSRFSFGAGENKDILQSASVEEEMFESNRITLSLTARRTKGQVGKLGLIDVSKLGLATVPFTSDNEALQCGPLGSALLYAAVAAWRSPCSAVTTYGEVGSENEEAAGVITDDPDITLVASTEGQIADAIESTDSTKLSGSHKENPYSDSKMDVTYKTNPGVLHVPLAGSSLDLISAGSTPTETAANIRVALPTTQKHAKFRMQRFKTYPNYPICNDFASGAMAIKKEVGTETPELWVDGENYVYGIKGEYTHGLLREIDDTVDNLDGGSLPYDASDLPTNAVPAGTGQLGILGEE